MSQPDTFTRIFVTFQFEAFHCWHDAPSRHQYLSRLHRHIFHVRIEWNVSHDNREREFICEKREAQRFVCAIIEKREEHVNWSCEMWARELLTLLNAQRVEVSEDGENGAYVERTQTS